MTPSQAYEEIRQRLSSIGAVKIVSSTFFLETFGNFIVAFTINESERSIVCDRGQVFACRDLEGTTGCEMIIANLAETDTHELLGVIEAHSRLC
jgi:hypothetical protein